MKSNSGIRTFIIGLVIIVLLTVILVILMSDQKSTQNVLTPLVVPIKGWFSGNRGHHGSGRGGNTTIVVGGSNSSSDSATVPEEVPEVTSPM